MVDSIADEVPPGPVAVAAYIQVFRLTTPPPAEGTEHFVRIGNTKVTFLRELTFSRAEPVILTEPGVAGLTMGVKTYEFPPAHYAVLEYEFVSFPDQDGRTTAKIRLSHVHTYLELLLPAVQAELKFEGLVTAPGVASTDFDGPKSLRAAPAIPVERLGEEAMRAIDLVDAAPDARRGKVALACRWFQRGMQADNPTDKVVYFCIALEVLLGQGDIVRKLRDHLAQAIPSTAPQDISTRLQLGQIYGLRSDVVHNGLVFLTAAETFAKTRLLHKAEAVTRAALLIEAGLPLGDVLARWLQEDAAP